MGMNVVFDWNESFLTGLATVDEQHKRLVDLVNDVGELALSGEEIDMQRFQSAGQAMLQYTMVHFRDEEHLMQTSGVDTRHVGEHKIQHRQFVAEAEVFADMRHNLTPERMKKMLGYLVDWLAYHILGIDQSMARQIRAIEKGLTPSEAFAAESKNVHDGTEPLLVALKGLF
jgi:hemerythrin